MLHQQHHRDRAQHAGERERRSLEVLMAQPAKAWELVVGKWLAAVVLVHEIAEVVVILNGVRAARRPAALRQLATVPARQPEPAHA